MTHTHQARNADGVGCTTRKQENQQSSRDAARGGTPMMMDFISQEVPVIVENCFTMGHGMSIMGPKEQETAMDSKSAAVKPVSDTLSKIVQPGKPRPVYANHSSGGNTWANNTPTIMERSITCGPVPGMNKQNRWCYTDRIKRHIMRTIRISQ